jgi:hypothetical protein
VRARTGASRVAGNLPWQLDPARGRSRAPIHLLGAAAADLYPRLPLCPWPAPPVGAANFAASATASTRFRLHQGAACATDGQPACDARGTAAHPRPRRRHLEGVAALVTLGITRLGIGAADDANDDERIGEFPIRTGACDCLLPTVVVKIVPVAVPCRLGG